MSKVGKLNTHRLRFRTRIHVRFAHCDAAGIVYYPRFFAMLALVVERWFDGLGFTYRHMHMERHEGVPAVNIQCEFMHPSRLGDVLDFELVVERLGRSSFTLSVTARGPAEDQDRLRARLVLAWAQLEGAPKSRPIPQSVRQAMEKFLLG